MSIVLEPDQYGRDKACADIRHIMLGRFAEIVLCAPNEHHFVVDLSPFGLRNAGTTLYASCEPCPPVVEMLRRLDAMPLPAVQIHDGEPDLRDLPGEVGDTTHGEGIHRGVGYAVAYKDVGFSEGYDDCSTARVRLEVVGEQPVVTVHTAAAEVGQGLVTGGAVKAASGLALNRVPIRPEHITGT